MTKFSRTIKEAAKAIAAATTNEEVKAALDGDTRKAVIAAADRQYDAIARLAAAELDAAKPAHKIEAAPEQAQDAGYIEMRSAADAANAANAAKKVKAPRERDPRLPAVGTVLTKTYKGAEYWITCGESDFTLANRHDGPDVPFKSLSLIAKTITGKTWNGYLFFGLTDRPVAKAYRQSELEIELVAVLANMVAGMQDGSANLRCPAHIMNVLQKAKDLGFQVSILD